MQNSRSLGPSLRPCRGCVVLVCALLALASQSCRFEGDVLGSYPRGEVSLADPSVAAGVSHPSVADPDGERAPAPRGPRRELASLSRGELWATWNSLRGDAYDLDHVDRRIADGARVACDPKTLVAHRGEHLRYQGSVQVDPSFRERLVRFEQVVVDVATEVYGRAPSRLRHFGAYSCRTTRNHSQRMSEHALGNAIDVMGFDFARASKTEPLPEGLPRDLRSAFQVRVSRHWQAGEKNPAAAVHSRFLRQLAERLSDRSDVFRGMIGPSRRDHADHFHLDMSPWRHAWW